MMAGVVKAVFRRGAYLGLCIYYMAMVFHTVCLAAPFEEWPLNLPVLSSLLLWGLSVSFCFSGRAGVR